jgi:hypothetical protein
MIFIDIVFSKHVLVLIVTNYELFEVDVVINFILQEVGVTLLN